MICSYKKLSSFFLVLLSLSGTFALAMPSRLSQRTAGIGRAIGNRMARNSLAWRLQPRAVQLNSLLGVRGGRLAVNPLASASPSLSQRALANDLAAEQRAAASDRIFQVRLPEEPTQSQAQASQVNEPRKTALEIVRERVAQQNPQEAPEKQVSEPKAEKSPGKQNKSAAELVRDRMKQTQQEIQKNTRVNIPQELNVPQTSQASVGQAARAVSQQPMDLISIPTPKVAKPVAESVDLGIGQPQSLQATKARIIYNNAMRALNRVLNGLEQLQGVQHDAPNYAQLHNQMRQALVAAQQQGYSVGFIDRKLVEQVGALPGSLAKLLQNQPDASGVIIPAQALGLMGVAKAPKIAQVLGLQGDFVPIIYKKIRNNALPAAGSVIDPEIEIVRASMNSNSPFQADRSKIIIQPMVQQLMPSADAQNADMRLAELPNGGNNNNGLQDNGANQNQRPPFDPTAPRYESRHAAPGKPKQPMDILRTLNGASLDDGGNPQGERANEAEVDRNNLPNIPAIAEPAGVEPKAPSHATPNVPRFDRHISHEESAIAQYGNLILQALLARTYLQIEWAGQSQSLHAMFVDYNALLTQYRTINDQFSNTLYTDSNQRIYQVVSMVLSGLERNKN